MSGFQLKKQLAFYQSQPMLLGSWFTETKLRPTSLVEDCDLKCTIAGPFLLKKELNMAIRYYEYKGKRLWEVQVSGIDPKGRRIQRRRRGLETKKSAEKLEFELKRELGMIKDGAVPYTWGEWYQICIDRIKLVHRPSTVEQYKRQLGKWVNPEWNNIELADISKNKVYEMVFEHLPAKLTPWSRKTNLKLIRRIFQMAVEDGLIPRNPTTGIRVPIADVDQKVFTNSEVEIFLQKAKELNHRFYPVWVMALMTGMRSGELYALKWVDIDFDAKIISVQRQWTRRNGYGPTKTQRSRVVPISDELLNFLKELKLKAGDNEFTLPHLPEWTQTAQAKVTKEFCEVIGITPIKFHDLRATFITNLLARGESLARVMSIVGHSQIKTTNVYLRKAGVDVQGGTDKLGYGIPYDKTGKIIAIKGGGDKSGNGHF